MASPQTLSLADRRVVAAWAADCAERVLPLFEAEAPGDGRPRDAIARARAFARGELDVAEEIRRRFVGAGVARDVGAHAAVAAARAAGQAAAVSHMGAHALGAAAYAAKAVGLAAADAAQPAGLGVAAADAAQPAGLDVAASAAQVAELAPGGLPDGVGEEIRWQLVHLSPEARAALRLLPPVGENRSGPLGPGRLASGQLGAIIRDLQAGLVVPEPAVAPGRRR